MKLLKTKGFTLIELLVVVAIIALLTTVILAALGDSKEKAAWSKFDSEILQMQKAVQLYLGDNNGGWPAIMSIINVDAVTGLASFLKDEELLGSEDVTVPSSVDPTTRFGHGYLTDSNGYFSCGGDHKDVHYVIYHHSLSTSASAMEPNRSLIFKQAYRNGSIYLEGKYSCFEFR